MNLRKRVCQCKKIIFKKILDDYKEIKRRKTKITNDLKNLRKEESKGKEESNHLRYINDLVREMMQLDKLLNEY